MGIGKYPQSVEAHLFNKFAQLIEMCFRFPGNPTSMVVRIVIPGTLSRICRISSRVSACVICRRMASRISSEACCKGISR